MRTLERILTDNSLTHWLLAAGIVVLVLAVAWALKHIVRRRVHTAARRTATVVDDLLADMLRSSYVLLWVPPALYLGAQVLDLPPRPERVLTHLAVTALLLQAALWASRLIAGWLKHTLRTRAAADPAGVTALNIIGYIARVGVWAFVVLLALDNFGFNITALLAGLGIGGVAVALAAQSVLGDLFASLAIVIDRPFVVGDFIVVGEQLGTVEYIGLKTTRLRSLSGEQIVFANSDLLKSRIHNYKRMQERRVLFRFGVVYQTPPEQLEALPVLVRRIIEELPRTRFDRAHFHAYGDSALLFEVVYYVQDPDYNVYMDIQQAINLALFRRLRAEGIEFAYPTRTLHIHAAGTAAGHTGGAA